MTDEEKDFALDRVALNLVDGIKRLQESGDPATEAWIYKFVRGSVGAIWDNGYEWGHSDTEENHIFAQLQVIKSRMEQTRKTLDD